MDSKPEPQLQETMSDQCKACGSLKKRDPTTSEDASGDGQPQLKKQETASVHESRLHGFSRVAVPPSIFYTNLSRTSSNLINSPGLDQPKQPSLENFPHSPLSTGVNPNVSTLSPSPVKGFSTELPPLPPLRRTVSDPLSITSPSRTGVTGHGEIGTGSPMMSQDSADAERFKRMMERMKEMKQWWQEVVLEVEDAGSLHNNTNEASNAETEEVVTIETWGDYLSIYLKCPCSKVYQLLISGSSCYYRLM